MDGSALNTGMINPTYADIGEGVDTGKGYYETLHNEGMAKRPLPIPYVVQTNTCKTVKQMKAYRVAVIVLSILCLLLIAAVILVYFLTRGQDANTTACLVEDQENDTGERTDYCSNHSCLHGGTCVEKDEKAGCECGIRYLGEKCEIDLGRLERDISRDIVFCRSSSAYSSDYVCDNALDDNQATQWLSGNEGVGAWYWIFFEQPRVITKLSILQRSHLRQTKEMELKFMDGTNQNIELKCSTVDDEFGMQDFILTPVNSSFIKITFTDVCTTRNNGLNHIQVWGI